MGHVHWIKQQDFCLRVGLLRGLVALLPTHGRSVDRGPVLRLLDKLLFARLSSVPSLENAASAVLGGRPDMLIGNGKKPATIADGLLITSGSSSWGQPVDHEKSAKILEWAHASGLVGAGNQMTERAVLLRSFFPDKAVAAFAKGDVEKWNPFVIPSIERAFFFYHLGELDEVFWRLAFAVGGLGSGAEISATMARRMTSDVLGAMLARLQDVALIQEMPLLRTVRELAMIIAAEVGGRPKQPLSRRPGPPRRATPSVIKGKENRHTTKNADHQAIPRFEMLVDLGFLTKPVPAGLVGLKLWNARNAWKFQVTLIAARFYSCLSELGIEPLVPWHWNHFAASLSNTLDLNTSDGTSTEEVVELFLRSYERVQRRSGHSPFESIALLTMLTAREQGMVIEIGELHEALSELRTSGALGDVVYFAAGHDVPRMFILFKPGAPERLRPWLKSKLEEIRKRKRHGASSMSLK